VGNKVDKVFNPRPGWNKYLLISAQEKIGLDELKTNILNQLLPNYPGEINEGVLTRARHLEAVSQASDFLISASQALKSDNRIELVAEDLRDASSALGEIMGDVTTDDILNRIFEDFCIGK
jgi:tRNA modification GTPase